LSIIVISLNRIKEIFPDKNISSIFEAKMFAGIFVEIKKSAIKQIMKTKIILVLLLVTLPTLALTPKPNYVGYKHKGVVYGETLPNGVKDLGGGLLSNEEYGVSRFSKGKKYMLWLEKITSRDGKGFPSWEVKDVLTFDLLKKDQEFLISYSSNCQQNGRASLDLIVQAELFPKEKTYKILRAWKANIKKEKFEKTSETKE
jgi:hypothetical protein